MAEPTPPRGSRRLAGTLALHRESCCLFEGDAGDFELEGFSAAVGNHEADLGYGFGGVIREVEAVAAADGIHFAQGDLDFLPIAAGGEFGEVVMAGLRVGLDDEAIILVFPRKSGLRERSCIGFSLVDVFCFGSSE
jgi:hypothetical protein